MAWQGFSNDNAPEAFGAMVRRQGASGGGGFRRPGGGYDGSGVTPPGPAGGGYVPGRMDGIIPPGPHGGGPAGFSGIDGFDGRGVPQPDPVLRGGEGGPYGMQPSKSGLPPMHNPEWFGLGGVVPPGPHGGGPKGFPGMDGGSEVGSKADQRPMPIPDPRFPRNQPGMTRNQWQQNRLGNAPRLPVENPINPTEDWLGRSNGAPQGWNWSR